MATKDINGKSVEFDSEGYLVNFDDWTPEVGTVLSEEYKIEFTSEHLAVAQLMREYYAEHDEVPTARDFTKLMGQKLGSDKGTHQYFTDLFKYEPLKQCGKIAGLPQLAGCM